MQSTEEQSSQPPASIHGYVRDSITLEPVEEALFGTSINGNTRTSASDGSFFLITETTVLGDTNYSVDISATGYQPYSSSANWGSNTRFQSSDPLEVSLH